MHPDDPATIPSAHGAGFSATHRPAHRAPRRPALSWPAALLPAALMLTLLSVGTVGSASSDVPVTDLHVVVGSGSAPD